MNLFQQLKVVNGITSYDVVAIRMNFEEHYESFVGGIKDCDITGECTCNDKLKVVYEQFGEDITTIIEKLIVGGVEKHAFMGTITMIEEQKYNGIVYMLTEKHIACEFTVVHVEVGIF